MNELDQALAEQDARKESLRVQEEQFNQASRDKLNSRLARENSYDSIGSNYQNVLANRNEAYEESTWEMLKRSGRSVNAAFGIYNYTQRLGIEADPDFDIENHKYLMDGIPLEYRGGFVSARSEAEARLYRDQTLKELDDKRVLSGAGTRGLVTTALAGIVDIDAPIMLFSGGGYMAAKGTALTTKVGLQGTRLAKGIEYGLKGAEAGLITETANAFVRPTGDWEDIPIAGFGGLAFGTALGVAGGRTLDEFKADEAGALYTDYLRKLFGKDPAESANKAAQDLREDFTDAVRNGETGRRDYEAGASVPDEVFRMDDMNDEMFASTGMQDIIAKSSEFAASMKFDKAFDKAFEGGAAAKAAGKFYKFLDKTPVRSDFDALFNSNSDVAKTFAYKTMESPAGIMRNNRSASMYHEVYTNQIAAPVNTSYAPAFNQWVAKNFPDEPTMVGVHRASRIDAFNKEIMKELQARYHDGAGFAPEGSPIKVMADAIDQASAKAQQILSDPNSPVRGAENLQAQKGWFRQQWKGDKIISIMKDIDSKLGKGAGRAAIEKSLAASYVRVNGWEAADALKYAKAVTRRGIASDKGLDTNLYRLLDEEGTEYMIQFLKDNGFSTAKAESMVNSLKGLKSEQNKQAFLKHRGDIDMRQQIEGTDYTIMDLMDTDVVGVWTGYARRAAGAAALARQGIQRGDKKRIIDAIIHEQESKGGGNLSREQLESMFSYFEGGAFSGGVNPWMRRMLQLTNLSLLNSLGLTQAAEMGVQVAAVGFDAFRKSAPKELQEMLSGKNSALMDELKGWTAVIDGEHRIFQDHLMLDDTRVDMGQYAEVGAFMDSMLKKGARMQGYLSGFYKMKQLQQRTAVRSMVYRLADSFRGGKEMNNVRLYDMGLTDEAMITRIGDYFRNGTVEMAEGGDVLKLNFDKWHPEDVVDFTFALNRHANQVVQKAMRGESTAWMHKTEGAILTHLKSFTITSMQKQLIRNARIMDEAATTAFIYSMVTAGVVYSAREAIAGRDKNLTSEKIMKGAFNLSNMTGWLPQWSDPVMSMLGMDSLKFNHYGSTGPGGDVVGVPPVLTTINRIAHIPESAVKVATGNYKNSDIYALQATPIIGNLYGFSYMWNALRHGN